MWHEKCIFVAKLQKNMEKKDKPDKNKERALHLYRQGAELWRQGDRAGAIAAYTESAALDSEGPGATALEMTRDIMNFYDTQQFNP